MVGISKLNSKVYVSPKKRWTFEFYNNTRLDLD